MEKLLYIAIGGGIGALLRHSITSILQRFLTKKHYATFFVNITGLIFFHCPLMNKQV